MQATERQRPIGYSRAKEMARTLLENSSCQSPETDLYQDGAVPLLARFAYEQLVFNLGVDYRGSALRVHAFYPDDSYAYLQSRSYNGNDGLDPTRKSSLEKFHLGWEDSSAGSFSFKVNTIRIAKAAMVEITIGNNGRTLYFSDTFEVASSLVR